MEKHSRIYVAGHRGMVGSAIVRKLETEGFHNIIKRTSKELDLRDQTACQQFFEQERPEYVFLAAAKVGGIVANNTYKADFIYDNITIQSNVIHNSYKAGVKKLLFLGSSCIYPKIAPQPLKEEYLLTGKLEPTNEPYAIAKIAGIKMCEAYRDQYGCDFFSVMPTNLYGPNDNYDLENSHVLGAFIRKFHEAKRDGKNVVTIWGTGRPKREFLHVDDLAEACFKLMNSRGRTPMLVNVGTGVDISIQELASLVQEIIGFEGTIVNDLSRPDGTPRKLLDLSLMRSKDWEPTIDLKTGLKRVYEQVKTETWY